MQIIQSAIVVLKTLVFIIWFLWILGIVYFIRPLDDTNTYLIISYSALTWALMAIPLDRNYVLSFVNISILLALSCILYIKSFIYFGMLIVMVLALTSLFVITFVGYRGKKE